MPAPAWQANSSQQTNVGAITVAWPTHSTSDLGLLLCQTANEAITEGDPDFVSLGAQGAGTPAAAGSTRLSIFWARATSSSMPSVVSSDSGDHQTGVIQTYRGAYVGRDPILVGFNTGTGTAVTFPAGTTDADNATVLMIVAHSNDAAGALCSGQTNTDLTSITEVFDNGATTGTGGGIAVATAIKATAGAFAAGTATLSTSATWVSATVVIHSLAAPAFVDSTPPVITVTNPETENDPLVVEIYDVDSALRQYQIGLKLTGSWRWIAYEDGEGFLPPFDRGSSVSGTGTLLDPKVITIYRYGGWSTGAPIDVRTLVVDAAGNKATA